MIVMPSEQGSWWDAAGACFYCGKERPADGVTVLWAGLDETKMWLHIRCAERLGTHLIADAREADLAEAKTAVWERRSERIKKAKLERQEWQR